MKDYLKKISSAGIAAIYEICPETEVKRFVVSTPYTRKILNNPEIHGFEYIHFLRKGVESFLTSPPGRQLFDNPEGAGISVLHFLRGGLNFGLLDLFYKCFGFTKVTASFMTSQRFQKGKRWMIKQDQYRKFALEGITTIVAGDVIATGTTLKNGFEYLKTLKNLPLEKFIFFTIGTPYTEKIIEKYFRVFKKKNRRFSAAVVYLEGRFSLVENRDEYPQAIPGTDLVKKNALLSPEFELSQSVSSILERCEVYDVGARAFNWKKHFRDIIEYWEKLADGDMKVLELYNLRWPFRYRDFAQFSEAKKKVWPEILGSFLKKLYAKEMKRVKYAITLDSWEFMSQHLKFLKNIYGGAEIKRIKGGKRV